MKTPRSESDLRKPGRFRRALRPLAFAAGGAVVIVGLFLLARLMFAKPDLPTIADNVLDSVLAGDAGAIYQHQWEQERAFNGLTKSEYEEFWRLLIAPRLAGFHLVKRLEPVLYGAGAEGWSAAILKDANGHSYEFDINVWKTPDGPRVLICDFLRTAWVMEGVVRQGKAMNTRNIDVAIGEGLKRDRPTLERLGMKGFVAINLQHGTLSNVSWDQCEQGVKSKLAKLDALGADSFGR